MCRILAVGSPEPTTLAPWLGAFAEQCRLSKEYQGDGWGLVWREGGRWERYRSVAPIWVDLPPPIPDSPIFLVHARSAFREDEVAVRHNMPFLSDSVAFAFNGELRGVRLSVEGSNGAARLFHLFKRFRASERNSTPAALRRLDRVIMERTEYVRALNLVVGDETGIYGHSRFSEDPDYFTLHHAKVRAPGGHPIDLVCSQPLTPPGTDPQWAPIPNATTWSVEGAGENVRIFSGVQPQSSSSGEVHSCSS